MRGVRPQDRYPSQAARTRLSIDETNERDVLDSRDFYEACQRYRHSQEFHKPPLMDTVEAFEALKDWIRENCFVGKRPMDEDGWLKNESRAFSSTEIKFCPACEKDWLE